MTITEDQIEKILHSQESAHRLLDLLALLEADRLVHLIASLVNEGGQSREAVKQSIIDALEQDKEIFGYLKLSQMFNLDDLLLQIYQSQP